MSDNNDDNDDRNIIKLRGLPWNSTAKDILEFLKDVQVIDEEKGVHLAISHRDGRPNGEAFVELVSPDDVDKAFEYNKNIMGNRYIEIFNAKADEFEFCIKRQNSVNQDTFVKLRGLPFSCKQEDIQEFFEGLEIRNGINGIYIQENRGRPTGECFVQFSSAEDTETAMKKNREKIGHRYIEIFRSSSSEWRRSSQGFNGNGGGNGGGGLGRNGGGGFNNDRMAMGGRGQRNNRTNFRDRPYPDTPWNQGNNNNQSNDMPWRNNNRSNNFGGGGGGSNFDGPGNNMFNNSNSSDNNNFSSDFERNWNSGGGLGGNSYNSFSNNNSNTKNPLASFDRDFGFNSNSNNSNSNGNSNFGGNDRFSNSGGNMNSGGGGGGGSGGGQYAVHLRGMPYECGESEVQDFFEPLKLLGVQILYNNNGRHTGEADAFFSNVADAQEAMKKHKEKMGSRYIELFAKSNDRRGGSSGGGRF